MNIWCSLLAKYNTECNTDYTWWNSLTGQEQCHCSDQRISVLLFSYWCEKAHQYALFPMEGRLAGLRRGLNSVSTFVVIMGGRQVLLQLTSHYMSQDLPFSGSNSLVGLLLFLLSLLFRQRTCPKRSSSNVCGDQEVSANGFSNFCFSLSYWLLHCLSDNVYWGMFWVVEWDPELRCWYQWASARGAKSGEWKQQPLCQPGAGG